MAFCHIPQFKVLTIKYFLTNSRDVIKIMCLFFIIMATPNSVGGFCQCT